MQNILDAVNKLAEKVDNLAAKIDALPTPSATVDLTPALEKFDLIAAALADVRAIEAPATVE